MLKHEQDRMTLVTQTDKIEKNTNQPSKPNELSDNTSVEKKESSYEEVKKKKNRKKCGPYKKKDKKGSPTKTIKKDKKKRDK